ncbi:hypothetical protein BCF55_1545 [Hydrogenivirga caldilitoris]|uniref:DUF945 domain-containing protein n=1 Tax=Hydrogenivirga caldilitoris TaxID=246264 RepID=A0A497XQI4_9AQUI|nr:hypothetical protein [Hydrogenivirga caldilitoris]RLJ71246.1 hypothetical protein BCF55_1545 [Hydrogenivirga caldilitoris]
MRKLPLVVFGAILLVLFSVGAVQVYASKKAEEEVKELLAKVGLKEQASYSKVSYSLLKGTTEVRDLRIRTKGGTSHAARVLITKFTDTDLELSITGIRGEDPEFEKFERQLRELGYEEVYINAMLSFSFYADSGELLIRKVRIEVPGAFRLELSLNLSGVDRELIRAVTENGGEDVNYLAQKLSVVTLKGGSLTLSDLGLRERLLRKEAQITGKEVEQVKREIAQQLKPKRSSEFDAKLYGALKELVERGGSISLEAKPEEPVEFQELVVASLLALQTKDPSELVDRLGIKVNYSPHQH